MDTGIFYVAPDVEPGIEVSFEAANVEGGGLYG